VRSAIEIDKYNTILLGKLFYFSSKSPLSNILPVHDKGKVD